MHIIDVENRDGIDVAANSCINIFRKILQLRSIRMDLNI
jgi:hypothetical protein